MKEQLISFETAKLAQEKGFENIISLPWSKEHWIPSAIYHSQSTLQKWLREIHNIEVITAPRFYGDNSLWYCYECLNIKVNDFKTLNNNLFQGIFTLYKTYEEALEEGLLQGLKLIP